MNSGFEIMAQDYPDNPSYFGADSGLKCVSSMKDRPTGPHFAIIQYGRGSGFSPAYDRHESDTTYFYLKQDYYWTDNRVEWELALQEAYAKAPTRTDLMAFEVKGIVKPKVTVQVVLEER